ncbi:beta-glucosidase [Granulicella sp. 5B5]|uniref:GH1 family beta-glucosidase n=1 Tax=Granulicella sp. 5B5 TaxID=1617967 RepID=UPI0015F67839|nr:GH1 family beta-glucosidase [Granulicella sp. 5B5]QMV18366.1 beta-glucosidase [Granulicella sp. 5B5]
MDRRKFLQTTGLTLGAGSLSSLVPSVLRAEPESVAHSATKFPTGFLWGSATASYQVEGAVHEGGRGVSIWDTFSHTPGKTANGDTGDVADDFYHRYPQDIAMMKRMGLQTFRFSVAWPRIFPNGTGKPNQQGVDFYNKLVDTLLAAGIQPYCTLFHWDLPQVLQDKGGWESREVAHAFADYSGYTAGFLSDRVKNFMTMNEMRSFAMIGYRDGRHAPGLQIGRKRMAQLNHNVVYAHGLSVGAIRAHAKGPVKVGLADNLEAATPCIEIPEHIEAARKGMRELNAMYQTVIQEGRYTDHYLKTLGPDAPHFTQEELDIIKSPLDFVGINCYTAHYVRAADNDAGFVSVPNPSSYPHMYSPWLTVGPEALYWGPKLSHELWGIKEIYITENGCSSADKIAEDGHIYDTDRVMYLRNYLTQLHRAVAEGVPVKGYFCWSLLDNYEWADGYDKRFGIVYVDFATQKRTPKLSAHFYESVIASNEVK